MKKTAVAFALAILLAVVPAATANAAVTAPDAVTSKYGEALGSASSGKYVVSSGTTYIIVDADGNYEGEYKGSSPNPGTVVEKYKQIVDYTEDGNYVVEDENGTLLIVDENGVVLGVYRGRITGRTSPKTSEFPVAAALTLTAVVSASGIVLCRRKENN